MMIGEEKRVRQVLRLSGEPLSPEEISIRLAGLPQVRDGQIGELSSPHIADSGLLMLADGRYALPEWVDLWIERELQVGEALQRSRRSRRAVRELGFQILNLNNEAAAFQSRVTELESLRSREERERQESVRKLADCEARLRRLGNQITVLIDREKMLLRRRALLSRAVRMGALVALLSLAAGLRWTSALTLYIGSVTLLGTLAAALLKLRTVHGVEKVLSQKTACGGNLQSAYQEADDVSARIRQSDSDEVRNKTELAWLQRQLQETHRLAAGAGQTLGQSVSAPEDQDENRLIKERAELKAYIQLAATTLETSCI